MSLYQRPFAAQIVFNLEQLNYRYSRLSEIDATKPENHYEYLMVFDSFLSLFRALFLEKGTKQYTVQNYLIKKGQKDVALEIDDYLNSNIFSWTEMSIRNVLKFIADKFVCHIDPISKEDLVLANYYMSHLGNPYVDNNLSKIIGKIAAIVEKGNKINTD